MQAMLAENWNPRQGLQYYVNHPDFVAEQKLDGHRVLLHIKDQELKAYNRNGQPSQHTSVASQELQKLISSAKTSELILDTELVGSTFFAFDLPLFTGLVQPSDPHEKRKSLLDKFEEIGTTNESLQIVKTARSAKQKRELILKCRDQGAEGIVLKDTTKAYVSGRNTNMLKVKYTKDIDVVVTQTHVDGKTNASLGIYNQYGELIEIGTASLIGKEEIHSGDVVEVRFLYLSSNGRLVQPRIKHKRPDKKAHDCTFSQINRSNTQELVQI